MNYDTGAEMLRGRMSRPHFDAETARDELAAIAGELRCDAVRISGQDTDRLTLATRIAHELGMAVYFSPLRADLREVEALAYLESMASIAEQLSGGGEIVFVAGLEATLFQHGFIHGETTDNRLRTVSN